MQGHTVAKNHLNATNVSIHPHFRGMWQFIKRNTVEKSQIDAKYVTMHQLMQAVFGDI